MDYWRALENCPLPMSLRTDILDNTYPAETVWFSADIELSDIDNIFMLPVTDFGPLSQHTWKLLPAADYFAQNFDAGTYDPKYPYNAAKMRRLLEWKKRMGSRV